jgi:hypothetical protein
MSTKQRNGQDGIEALHEETSPKPVPETWLDDAPNPTVDEDETRYYAVLHTIEHTVTDDHEVLRGDKPGAPEDWTVHVLYVRADGQRRVSRHLDARVVETTNGLDVTPRGFTASIAVDGDHVTPVARPVTDQIERALNDLHGIEVDDDE